MVKKGLLPGNFQLCYFHPYRNPIKASIAIKYSDTPYKTFVCGYKYFFVPISEKDIGFAKTPAQRVFAVVYYNLHDTGV